MVEADLFFGPFYPNSFLTLKPFAYAEGFLFHIFTNTEYKEKKNMKNKQIIGAVIGVILLIALVTGMLFLYDRFREKPVEGSKEITIEVIDDKEKTTTYQVKTDAEYLEQAMKETEGLEFSGETGEYGFTLYEINGVEADFNVDGAYWNLIVNGEYGNYGISQQPVEDGDIFQLIYTVYAAE